MRISHIRDEIIAPRVPVSVPVLRSKTDMLYRQPELRAVLPGRRLGGGDNLGLTATYAATALVLLTAMHNGSRETIGPEIVRLWGARCVTPTGNPIERCKTAGEALTLLLKDANFRARLLFFEVDQDIPHLALVFGPADALASTKPLAMLDWQKRIDDAVKASKLSRTFYAPFTPKQWQRRVDDAFRRGDMAHVCRLAPATLTKIAELISQEG
jgi:hypothetical protein